MPLVPLLAHIVLVLALAMTLCFSIGVAAGIRMAVKDTRPLKVVTLHGVSIQLAVGMFWALLVLIIILEEQMWAAGSRPPIPAETILRHAVSVVVFVSFFWLAKKHDGKLGMKTHLPFAIPCCIAFFAVLKTGYELYLAITK